MIHTIRLKSFLHLGLPLLLSSLIWTFESCNSIEKGERLKVLDVLEGIENVQTVSLSDIVSGVEFILLDTENEIVYIHPTWASYSIGDSSIIVINQEPAEILHFNRKGRFLNRIGSIGKGPGEYISNQVVEIDHINEKIIIADNVTKKFVLYNFRGEFLGGKDYPVNVNLSRINDICIFGEEGYAIMCSRLPANNHTFYELLLFNQDFNVVKKAKPEKLAGNINSGISRIYTVGEDVHFWSAWYDTVYLLNKNFTYDPIYNLKTKRVKPTENELSDPNYSPWTSTSTKINSVYETVDFIQLAGISNGSLFILYYDKKYETFINLSATNFCRLSDQISQGFNNDITGLSPVRFQRYQSSQNLFIETFNFGHIGFFNQANDQTLTECLANQEVRLPKYRDGFIQKVRQMTENSNPLLILWKLKK